jgi:hypothetical protein
VANVRDDCLLLGERLIEQEEEHLGRMLIANGLRHDNSKFHGIEWAYLHSDVKESNPDLFLVAMHQHNLTNLHHPEAWPGGIEDMDRLHLAEMVTDWHSRSSEFGSDLLEWVKESATKRFRFATTGRVYKDIKSFVDLLHEEKFK